MGMFDVKKVQGNPNNFKNTKSFAGEAAKVLGIAGAAAGGIYAIVNGLDLFTKPVEHQGGNRPQGNYRRHRN